jgi:uncharacterized OB-fold protein
MTFVSIILRYDEYLKGYKENWYLIVQCDVCGHVFCLDRMNMKATRSDRYDTC